MTKRKIRLTAGMIAVLILFIQLPVSAAVPGDPQSLYAKPHKAVFAVDEADEVSGTLEDTDAEEMPADLAEAENNEEGSNDETEVTEEFKGLEADAIIIVDFDKDVFSDEEGKRLFYVGSSRAKHNLEIVYVGEDDGISEITKDLSEQKFPNAKIGIARCLNVKPITQ